ncbi:MAG: hypothetical protein H0W88_08180 [Parachlamydiaceae bacterium]|nr:hypothetical protein [Parachlamydiaceae bacterium]
MNDNNQIFNFVSNSYSKFLNYSHINTVSQTESTFSYPNNEFLNQSSSLHHQIYLTQKKQARLHKIIFFGLSFIFFTLAAIVFFNTTNWACSLYFSNCAFIKAAIYTLCLLLSSFTFSIGYFAKPERDTAYYLFHKMERKLKGLYKKRRSEIGFLFSFNEDNRIKKVIFKQGYNQALERMREQKEKTLHVLERITSSIEHGIHEKEELVNHCLSDMHQSLSNIIQSFKQKSYLLAINNIPRAI